MKPTIEIERLKRHIRRLQFELREVKNDRDEWEKTYRLLLKKHDATLADLQWYQDNCDCNQK